MNRFAFGVIGSALVFVCSILQAQVPQILNYQGRVAVGTTNFNGTGAFKFALVNAAGTTAYWTNDGTHLDGTEPTAAVSLTVVKGLYSVLLGDTSLANMTAVPASVFNNSDVRLRVWFNNGTNGSQLLTPDQRIAAVGYSVMAGNVPDGAITGAKIAAGAVGTAQLGIGAVTGANLAVGAAAANLGVSGQGVVPTGGTILSANPADPSLINAGYVSLGRVETGDLWEPLTPASPPTIRAQHSAVWTGTEMIVWGGRNASGNLDTGGRYDLAANTWTALPTLNAPGAHFGQTAIWTGTEMILFGGDTGAGVSVGMRRYRRSTDTWIVPAGGEPAARVDHSAVWTGTEMIVWGGHGNAAPLNNGSRFNPATVTWTPIPTIPTPNIGASGHAAVWTGSEMIIWGGDQTGQSTGPGARYSPTTNSWILLPTASAPALRGGACAVWTGTEMLIWGGVDSIKTKTNHYFNDGGRYNPTTNTWTGLTSAGAPSARTQHTAVWNGTEMLVWGGVGANGVIATDGGRYNPTTGAWAPLTTVGPAARTQHTAVWIGNRMLTFGGTDNVNYFNDTYNYLPVRTLYLYQRP